MNYRVVISQTARDELAAATQWWSENRSRSEAERWYSGFVQKLASLARSPESYPPAAEDSEFSYSIRQVNYGVSARATHRAVFTIQDPDRVVILTVRHTAQDVVREEDVHLD